MAAETLRTRNFISAVSGWPPWTAGTHKGMCSKARSRASSDSEATRVIVEVDVCIVKTQGTRALWCEEH